MLLMTVTVKPLPYKQDFVILQERLKKAFKQMQKMK
jgi:hypothetical protein